MACHPRNDPSTSNRALHCLALFYLTFLSDFTFCPSLRRSFLPLLLPLPKNKKQEKKTVKKIISKEFQKVGTGQSSNGTEGGLPHVTHEVLRYLLRYLGAVGRYLSAQVKDKLCSRYCTEADRQNAPLSLLFPLFFSFLFFFFSFS